MALPVFVNSIGMYDDPAAAPPGPTPSHISSADVRHLDVDAEALLDACVPAPPVVPPPDPAEALGVDDESDPAISAAPAASVRYR